MFTLPDVIHLFADEFSGLCGGCFPFPCILASSLDCFLFRHSYLPASSCKFDSVFM